MGSKGYRLGLWVNLIQRAEPHRVVRARHDVAAHVAFETRIFETRISPDGKSLETRRFQAVGQLNFQRNVQSRATMLATISRWCGWMNGSSLSEL
jgi:hypothetical protein